MSNERTVRVLFVCTHNSARSQMAQGLLNHLFGGSAEAYSAGTSKKYVREHAIQAMSNRGIDISRQYSKTLDEARELAQFFDIVVTVCDSASAACPRASLPPCTKVVHKGFDDPASVDATDDSTQLQAFERVRDEIEDWIKHSLMPLVDDTRSSNR